MVENIKRKVLIGLAITVLIGITVFLLIHFLGSGGTSGEDETTIPESLSEVTERSDLKTQGETPDKIDWGPTLFQEDWRTLPEASEEAVNELVATWLNIRPIHVDTHTLKDTYEPWIGFSGDCQFTLKQMPLKETELEEGDRFGYSMDTCSSLLGRCAIGAPGRNGGKGAVYVLDEKLDIIQQLTVSDDTASSPENMHFGIYCSLSPTGLYLAIQSDGYVRIYRWNGHSYEFESELFFDNFHVVLGLAPEGTMWITNQSSNTLLVYEREKGSGTSWIEVASAPTMAMDLVYEPTTDHVWVASAEGIRHWSRNTRHQWVENACWAEDNGLTAVDQFSPHRDGEHVLVLGQAQMDSLALVSAVNPYRIIDRIHMPGKFSASTSTAASCCLFSEQVMWWPEAKRLLVTSPWDSVDGVRHAGSFTAYEIDSVGTTTLSPTDCFRDPAGPGYMAEFGGNVKQLDTQRVLICSSGSNSSRGAVFILTLTSI